MAAKDIAEAALSLITTEAMYLSQLTTSPRADGERSRIGTIPALCTVATLTKGAEQDRARMRVAELLESAVELQSGHGGFGDAPNGHFVLPAMAEGISLLWDLANRDSRDRWMYSFLKGVTTLRNGATSGGPVVGTTGLTAGSELSWWTNGNIEILEALSYWWAYQLTGDDWWDLTYDLQWSWLGVLASDRTTGTPAGMGLVQQPQGWYWTETGNAIGTTQSGYDPDYTQVQLSHCLMLWEVSRDARARDYAQNIARWLAYQMTLTGSGGSADQARIPGSGTRKDYPYVALMTPAGLYVPALSGSVEKTWANVLDTFGVEKRQNYTLWHQRNISDIASMYVRGYEPMWPARSRRIGPVQ